MTTAPHAEAPLIFTSHASGYDAMRRGLVPDFDGFYGHALDRIDDWRAPDVPLSVLDLGAGTGLLSAMILQRRPHARITCVDGSEGMLDQARSRFAGDDRISYLRADLREVDLGTGWDPVVSALAIHHLEDDAKAALYGRVRSALAPGGLFLNAEMVAGESAEATERYGAHWLADVRAAGVGEEDIAKAQERMTFDRYASVSAQLAWLRDAGFTDVDCSYQRWHFAVMSATA